MPLPPSRLTIALALAAAATALPAQTTPRRADGQQIAPTAPATRLVLKAGHVRRGGITLDGSLDEPEWRRVEVASDFTQLRPSGGEAAHERTEARVLYDDDALYIGMRMYDPHPDSIAAQLARRDITGIFSDWAHVVVDSYHDRRTGYRFSVNPRGVQKDVRHFDDTNEDLLWDAVWQVATRIDSLGWTAEYRIPFSQLRFSNTRSGEARTWGINFGREVARRGEVSYWSPVPVNINQFVSVAGALTGIDSLPRLHRLELQPYLSEKLERAPGSAADPFHHANELSTGAGLDFRYGPTPGLTLTGTVNPDFGQVELDPAAVNLSAFELFFPERRPFFVEGADIFRFGDTRAQNTFGMPTYFYSRRIGRGPQRNPWATPGVAWADLPLATTIAAATKLSGKTKSGWSIGVLDAVTAREEAPVRMSDGEHGKLEVEPLTNYFVGRVRKDLRRGNSVVGGLLTSVHRDLGDSTLRQLLRRDAWVSGVDFGHSWADRRWTVDGSFSGSLVRGDTTVILATQRSPVRSYQRPDADHLGVNPHRDYLTGTAGHLALAKRGGTVTGSAAAQWTTAGYEANDLGFQTQSDRYTFSTIAIYNQNRATKRFRQWDALVYQNDAVNRGGDHVYAGRAAAGDVTFLNFWGASGRYTYNPWFVSDRLLRGGPLAGSPSRHQAGVSFSSDSRRMIVAGLELDASDDASGEHDRAIELELSARPSTSLRVSVEPGFSGETDTDQYVLAAPDPTATATYGRRYVFADTRTQTFAVPIRVNWTFTPTLSLELYAQPFISSVDYRRYKEFERPGAYDFAVYGRDRGTIARNDTTGVVTIDPDGDGAANPIAFEATARTQRGDFVYRSLRGNAVLRWEYQPGSTLFFVWQQDRESMIDAPFIAGGRDWSALRNEPARNVFLVKATYWLAR